MWHYICALLLLSSGGVWGEEVQFHRRLVKDLIDFSGYDLRVRPVRNNSLPVTVTHRMNLYQILEVNEPKQKLVLYVWVTQYWTDEYLGYDYPLLYLELNEPKLKLVLYVWVTPYWTDEYLGWDPAEYGGITSVVLPWNDIWLPDTYLYNSLEMTRESTERFISVHFTTRLVNDTNNNSYWVADGIMQFPAIYQFTCKMNILLFPFDQQNCNMTFGSWTFDSGGIDYAPKREFVSFESYISNEEWRVISFNYVREEIKYQCCPHPWVLLHLNLHIQRKPLYYIVNLIFPTAIITFIAIVGFFMPATTSGERLEKVNLGITTLLAMSILLLMVSDQMPTTSDYISIMGWYFLSIILLISAGTVLTSIIILINQQGNYGKPLPPCLAKDELNVMVDSLYSENRTASPKVRWRRLESPFAVLDSINDTTQCLGQYLDKRELSESVMAEWSYFCFVLDRVCLIVFSLGVGAVTSSLLLFGVFQDHLPSIDDPK